MIRINTDSYNILGQQYGFPSQKCGKSGPYTLDIPPRLPHLFTKSPSVFFWHDVFNFLWNSLPEELLFIRHKAMRLTHGVLYLVPAYIPGFDFNGNALLTAFQCLERITKLDDTVVQCSSISIKFFRSVWLRVHDNGSGICRTLKLVSDKCIPGSIPCCIA